MPELEERSQAAASVRFMDKLMLDRPLNTIENSPQHSGFASQKQIGKTV